MITLWLNLKQEKRKSKKWGKKESKCAQLMMLTDEWSWRNKYNHYEYQSLPVSNPVPSSCTFKTNSSDLLFKETSKMPRWVCSKACFKALEINSLRINPQGTARVTSRDMFLISTEKPIIITCYKLSFRKKALLSLPWVRMVNF